MKSAVETLSPTRAKITVEVPFEELKPSLDAAYQAIAKQINIPGFRKGKVPPPVIDRQVGRGAVLDEAINDALPKLYVQALQDNDLQPLAQPEIDVTKLEDNTLFEFTAEVDVRPGDRGPVVRRPERAGRRHRPSPTRTSTSRSRPCVSASPPSRTSSAPPQDGDVATIDLKATRDGEPVEGGEVSGYSYKVGSGDMLDGIDDALRGLSAGEEKTFTSQLLGGDLSGEDVEVSGQAVARSRSRSCPSSTTTSPRPPRSSTPIEELREDVATRLERGKRLEQAAAARDAVLEQLLDSRRDPAPRGRRRRGARRSPPGDRAAAGVRRHDDGAVPRQREADHRRVRGRAREAGPRRDGLAVPPRRDRQGRGDRRRAGRALRSTCSAGPSSRARTPTSSSSTWSSTTTSPRWSPRSCAARRWPGSSRARPSPTSPATRST